MKKQYIYIVCWLVVGALEGCCLYGYEYIEPDTDKRIFKLPFLITYFKDSLDNNATMWYYDYECSVSEYDSNGSDRCEKIRSEYCKQRAQIFGTVDLNHDLQASYHGSSWRQGDLTIPIAHATPSFNSTQVLDSISIRGAVYYNAYYIQPQAEDSSDVQSLVLSYTLDLLKLKLNNGTVWERLP